MKVIRQLSLDEIAHKAKTSKSKVRRFVQLIKRSMQPLSKNISVTENDLKRYYIVERRGIGILNTLYGKFWEFSFTINDQWKKYSVIVKSEIDPVSLVPVFKDKKNLVLRTDSGCETGQLYGDMTCECGDQLHLAMKTISERGEGMIISIPTQDGRGMGITFKLATLWVQDVLKLNTVESASLLAPDGIIDVRTYSGAICILKFFGISETCKINLATNNPEKAKVFRENGYQLGDFTPVIVEPTKLTREHLTAKQLFLGHNLNIL